jgi:hypothetical protein
MYNCHSPSLLTYNAYKNTSESRFCLRALSPDPLTLRQGGPTPGRQPASILPGASRLVHRTRLHAQQAFCTSSDTTSEEAGISTCLSIGT